MAEQLRPPHVMHVSVVQRYILLPQSQPFRRLIPRGRYACACGMVVAVRVNQRKEKVPLGLVLDDGGSLYETMSKTLIPGFQDEKRFGLV